MKRIIDTSRFTRLYSDLMKFIASAIYDPILFENPVFVGYKKLEIKSKIMQLDSTLTRIVLPFMDDTKKEVIRLERQLLRSGFGRQKERKDLTTAAADDLLDRLLWANRRIQKYAYQFLDLLVKVDDKIEFSVQNLMPLDFYGDVNREIKKNATRLNLVTKTGYTYRATGTINQAKKKIMQLIQDLFGDVDFLEINGRNYNPKKYVDMLAKTEFMKLQAKAMIQTSKEYGNDLIQMSTHYNACPECQQYEGNVYSISGRHPVYPKLDIELPIHPRCQHSWRVYIELEAAA